ncbi:MAG TPA: phospholipase A [Burkholderiales bacterium]|nr:phospholipase A [Burkholderiales bacterium]
MFRIIVLLLISILGAGAAYAGVVVVPTSAPVFAGKAMSVSVLVTNETDTVQNYAVPHQIDARLRSGQRVFDVTLTEQSDTSHSSFILQPQSFRKLTFSMVVPAGVSGPATLEIDTFVAGKTMFDVASAAPEQAPPMRTAPAPRAAAPAVQLPEPAQTTVALGDDVVSPGTFGSGLSTYEPIYFAVGSRDGWNAKFQLSFKYRLFNPSGEFTQQYPRLGNLYFGYTQTSLWDLSARSSPFKDSSYRPSLFYYDSDVWNNANSRTRIGFQGGLEHESNGQGGANSRSINIAFVRPIFTLGDYGDYHWTIAPKLWTYLEKDDNPDIADYRGYGELLIKYGKKDKWQIATRLRKGTRAHVGSVEVDLSYPLRSAALGNLNGYLLLQYFNGYGETILDYDQKFESQFRIGLMLVR